VEAKRIQRTMVIHCESVTRSPIIPRTPGRPIRRCNTPRTDEITASSTRKHFSRLIQTGRLGTRKGSCQGNCQISVHDVATSRWRWNAYMYVCIHALLRHTRHQTTIGNRLATNHHHKSSPKPRSRSPATGGVAHSLTSLAASFRLTSALSLIKVSGR
jgi:hypothetical protein